MSRTMDCYQDAEEHPEIYQGDAFQWAIDEGLLTRIFKQLTGDGLTKPFHDLLEAIAPAPPFSVRKVFPCRGKSRRPIIPTSGDVQMW